MAQISRGARMGLWIALIALDTLAGLSCVTIGGLLLWVRASGKLPPETLHMLFALGIGSFIAGLLATLGAWLTMTRKRWAYGFCIVANLLAAVIALVLFGLGYFMGAQTEDGKDLSNVLLLVVYEGVYVGCAVVTRVLARSDPKLGSASEQAARARHRAVMNPTKKP